MTFTQETQLWPVSGSELLKRQGSLWPALADDQEPLEDLAEMRALLMRQELDQLRSLSSRHLVHQASDFVYSARGRVTLRQLSAEPVVYQLPPGVLNLGGFYAGEYFEQGRDFRLEGDRLSFFRPVDLGKTSRVYGRGIYRLTGDVTRFWSKLLRQATPETSWEGMLRCLYDGIVGQTSELSLRNLVGEVFEVPRVQQASIVVRIETLYSRPLVITEHETLVGAIDDTPAVALGDLVAPGDFVFESVRFHDFAVSRPPSWLTSLRVPARYFPKSIREPIEFAGTAQAVTATQIGSRIRVRFPITTGRAADATAFWDFVDAQEAALGYGLAQLITGHPAPTLDQIPASVVPLEVLWPLWLNLGVSVSVVRLVPTAEHLGRLALLRRLVPPWLTHFVHFDQSEPRPYDKFC